MNHIEELPSGLQHLLTYLLKSDSMCIPMCTFRVVVLYVVICLGAVDVGGDAGCGTHGSDVAVDRDGERRTFPIVVFGFRTRINLFLLLGGRSGGRGGR